MIYTFITGTNLKLKTIQHVKSRNGPLYYTFRLMNSTKHGLINSQMFCFEMFYN